MKPHDRTWTALELRGLAVAWLRDVMPKAQLIPEFVCGVGGQARIDLAAIGEDEIVGIEIKADTDSPARLALQPNAYARVCRRVFYLPAPRFHVRHSGARPPEWGQLELRPVSGGAYIAELYPAGAGGYESPRALLDLLWRDELIKLAKAKGVEVKRRQTAAALADGLANLFCLPELRVAVCAALRARRWTKLGRDDTSSRVILFDELADADAH